MRFLKSILLLSLVLSYATIASAQDKPRDWEEVKSQKLKPLTDTEKAAITDSIPDAPTAKPQSDRRVLVFYRCEGFVHGSIPSANFCVEEMGRKSGAFSVDLADTYDVFSSENLKQYDAIVLNNTTHLQFPKPEQLNAFLDFVTQGKGLACIHAASDNFGSHPQALAMVGGEFGGHPWRKNGTWAFKLDDPDHTLNAAFDGKGFWHRDEVYQYKPETFVGTDKLRILVSLDMTKKEVSGRIKDGPREVPVSWVRTAGDGRVFYTNFGHNNETFSNPAMVLHMLDGIQYAIGDLEADAKPTDDLEQSEPALAPEKQ